jgi:hypothetical protein
MSAGVNGPQSTLSRALPKEVATFDLIDGVWVVEPRCAAIIILETGLYESVMKLR